MANYPRDTVSQDVDTTLISLFKKYLSHEYNEKLTMYFIQALNMFVIKDGINRPKDMIDFINDEEFFQEIRRIYASSNEMCRVCIITIFGNFNFLE